MEIGLDLVSSVFLVYACESCTNMTRHQAKIHAASRELNIVGYYHASDKVNDTTLPPVGEKIMGWIRAQFSQAVAFVVSIWPKLVRSYGQALMCFT
jgi:hypothetical protein